MVPPWSLLGPSWVPLGCFCASPGCLLRASWVPLDASWVPLGDSWVPPKFCLGCPLRIPPWISQVSHLAQEISTKISHQVISARWSPKAVAQACTSVLLNFALQVIQPRRLRPFWSPIHTDYRVCSWRYHRVCSWRYHRVCFPSTSTCQKIQVSTSSPPRQSFA